MLMYIISSLYNPVEAYGNYFLNQRKKIDNVVFLKTFIKMFLTN